MESRKQQGQHAKYVKVDIVEQWHCEESTDNDEKATETMMMLMSKCRLSLICLPSIGLLLLLSLIALPLLLQLQILLN
jgi:hypothetical protein